jgi:hypothetical protein
MAVEAVRYPHGQCEAVVKYGTASNGKARYREAHSLAASPLRTSEERLVVLQRKGRAVLTTLSPKTRSSFAPDYRRFRSLRLRAGGRPRLATPPPSR